MAGMVQLRDFNWEVTYSHEDGDLVSMFYVPALHRAKLYRRATGYFSADVLALAARGLDALIDGGGRMHLLVGCTLGPEEVEAISAGYDVRAAVERSMLNRLALENEHPEARKNLGYLTWMIAHGFLDVKVAVPLDQNGQIRAGLGLYHAKMGIITDAKGDQLVFKGSINETPSGWAINCESFDVNCSWTSDTDRSRVDRSEAEFAKLWSGKARSAMVMDVPEAVKQKLLEFLPKDDVWIKPPRTEGEGDEEPVDEVIEPIESSMALEARRRAVWAFVRDAASRPDGAMVSVATGVVQPWPHQLRAYKRMLDHWPFRLLVADEVGLGKTIEAGMIIRHAWISGLAKRILILTPAGVMTQWQAELYEKFNLLVPIYDGQKLNWPEHHGRCIELEEQVGRKDWVSQPLVLASSHLMRRRERQPELETAEDWDLLVVDEAHHARRKAAGTAQEGGPNRLLGLLHKIQAKAKSLLLMTATPMQVHPVELWDLLNVLGLPQQWHAQAFMNYFETLGRNPDDATLFDLAKLFQVTEQAFGPVSQDVVEDVANASGLESKLRQKQVLAALRESTSTIPLKRLDVKQRRLATRLLKAFSPVSHRMSRHTRSLLRQYFKAGKLATPIATRDPRDKAVELTPKERAVYDRVEDYISDTYQKASQDKRSAVGFVMTIYRRRLASSFYALRRTLTNRLEGIQGRTRSNTAQAALFIDEDLPQDEDVSEQLSADEASDLENEALVVEEENEINSLLKDIAMLGTDTKAIEAIKQLEEAFKEGYDSAIVFTQYTDTLDFLKEFLADRLSMPIGTYSGRGGEKRDRSGRWTRQTKEQIKRQLREGQIKILICTDAAGEGLNLQTCGVLINYDLPWNPMKVEQRIGRIDRIGQKYPVVRVINLAYADTVEADVYFALSERIDLFQGLVGKLQPILSRLPKEFEAAALRRRDDRKKGRQQLVYSVESQVTSAENDGFDIDAVSDLDLRAPDMPPSPLSLDDLDEIVRHKELIPADVECESLDDRSFKIRLPGMSESVRATTSSQIFDDQFESHQMLSFDGPVFRKLIELGTQHENATHQDASLESIMMIRKTI